MRPHRNEGASSQRRAPQRNAKESPTEKSWKWGAGMSCALRPLVDPAQTHTVNLMRQDLDAILACMRTRATAASPADASERGRSERRGKTLLATSIVLLATAGFAEPSPAQQPPRTATLVVDPKLAAHADATQVVATVADAAQWLRAHPDATQAIDIRLTAGLHTCRTAASFSGPFRSLSIQPLAGRATLIGGLPIPAPDWHACDPAIAARVPEVARKHVRALQLSRKDLADFDGGLSGPVHQGHGVTVAAVSTEVFLGGVPLVPARWPNQGYAPIDGLVDAGSIPRNAEDDIPLARRSQEAPRGGTFRVQDPQRLARWQQSREPWAGGFWNWDWSDELLPIAKIDAEAGTIALAQPHRYGLAARGRFYVTNLIEELDAPGECWLDVEHACVYAWLPDGTDQLPVEVSLLAAPMLTVDNGTQVTLRNLNFVTTRGTAVTMRKATQAAIEDCSFARMGVHALDLEGRAIAVTRVQCDGIGGTGVILAGGDRPTLTPSGSSITQSTFRNCGRVLRTYNPAVRLIGVGHSFAHNEVADHPHIALWFQGNDHRIEANFVHDAVLETGDAGALYCGRDWTSHGNLIRGNLFANIRGSDARFQNAVYLDDMASGIAVQDNLFVRCNWGILAGGGRDVHLHNNTFALCGKAIFFDARGIGWMRDEIRDPSTSTLLRNLAAMPIAAEPWRTRFPSLQRYRDDRFGRPVGSDIQGTMLMASPLGTIEDRECVRESGTQTVPLDEAQATQITNAWLQVARQQAITIAGRSFGPVGPKR